MFSLCFTSKLSLYLVILTVVPKAGVVINEAATFLCASLLNFKASKSCSLILSGITLGEGEDLGLLLRALHLALTTDASISWLLLA